MSDKHIVKTVFITNQKHFAMESALFDAKNKCSTYCGYETLYNLQEELPYWPKGSEDWLSQEHRVDERIRNEIRKTFTNRNTTWVNTRHTGATVDKQGIRFFNHTYNILQDIDKGIGIIIPIHISRFRNGRCLIHPGAKRIHMFQIYKGKVFCILSDYMKKPIKNIGLDIPKNIEYDWHEHGALHLRYIKWNQAMHKRSDQKDVLYRDVIGIPYGRKEFAHTHIQENIIELKQNSVKVNKRTIAKEINGLWQLVNE